MKNYSSKYTDKLITPAQLLAEIMCERMAKKDKRELISHFWNNDYWLRPFKMQLRFANQLLKIYSCEAIVNALNTFQGKKIYSLSAKWLDPIIKEEERKLVDKIKNTITTEKKEQVIVIEKTERQPYKKYKTEIDKMG